MMNLGNLKKAVGSTKDNKRVGRGEGSGSGVTAGRGNKGQHSRSGSKKRPWFEGGQMPLQRRLPKFGFTNNNKKIYQIVNLGELSKLDESKEITPEILKETGLIKYADRPVKVLGKGLIEKKYTIKVHAVSKTAKEGIEKLGGSVTLL
jgi:large subunit ribosomal protein L15